MVEDAGLCVSSNGDYNAIFQAIGCIDKASVHTASQHCCCSKGINAHAIWCGYAHEKETSTFSTGSSLPVLTCHKDTQLGGVTAALLDSLLESGTDGLLEGSAPADIEA